MAANGIDIIATYRRWVQDASNFRLRWEVMAKYLAPSRQGIVSQYAPGVKQSQDVFDSTSIMAADLFAMFLAGEIMNPAHRWLLYGMNQPEFNKNDEVREWNDECRDRGLKRLSQSTFYGEGPESLVDWSAFGTNFLMLDELPQSVSRTTSGFRGLHCRAVKTGRFVIQEGADGMVDSAMQQYKVSARVCQDRWGKDVLAPAMKAKIDSGKSDTLFDVVHAILPRPKAQRKAGALGMPWMSAWVDLDSKTVLHEGGYRIFPAAVSRMRQTPGEIYGRGQGDIAFPDTWTLNMAKSMGLEDLALKIRPPVFMRSGAVIGTLKLIPAGATTINTHGSRIQDSLMAYETGSHPEVSNLKEEQLRQSIREIFFVEVIRQLLQVNKSEMTAFEFEQKLVLLYKMISTVYGRLRREFLQSVANIVWTLQFEEGDFPPPPPILQQSNGLIDVSFENPLDRAQRSGDVEALTHAVQDMAPLAQLLGPGVFDRLDADKVASGIYDRRGVPATWLRNDQEFAEKRAADQQAMQQQKQMAMIEQSATAAGKAAPFLEAIKPQPVGAPS